MTAGLSGSFPGLILVYAALFAAYGTESPFLPSFLGEHGASAGEIGIVLAAGTGVRLAAGPLAGLLADRYAAARLVLGAAAAAAGALAFAYLPAHGFWPLLAVSMAHSVATAPLAPLSDALAIEAADRERTFLYGWVRGAGSAAFILGTLASGFLVGRYGSASIIVASGVLFLAMALATARVAPLRPPVRRGPDAPWRALLGLMGLARFRWVLAVGALVIGSHAMHDAFAVIRWRGAGIDPDTIGFLWSAAVASEIVVFVLAGPFLLRRLGPARCAALAALAGAVRWSVMATTTSEPLLAMSQVSHGLTFALLHLVAMNLIGAAVPEGLRASAQTIYGTFGLGIASVTLTLASGGLYDRLGGSAFWFMAVLCLLALPLTARLGPGAPIS